MVRQFLKVLRKVIVVFLAAIGPAKQKVEVSLFCPALQLILLVRVANGLLVRPAHKAYTKIALLLLAHSEMGHSLTSIGPAPCS